MFRLIIQMLQEESIKRLARQLHSSFARAYFVEFAAKLDMDIAPKRLKNLEHVEVSQKQRIGEQRTNNFQEKSRHRSPQLDEDFNPDPNGQGRAYAGNPVYQREARERTSATQRPPLARSKTRESSEIGSQMELLRAISQISEIEPQPITETATQPVTASSSKRPLQRTNTNFSQRALAVTKSHKMNKSGQSFKKGAETSGNRSHELTRMSRTRKNQQQSSKAQTSKKSFMQDMEAVYGDKATYLSIGDTILLGYKQKVFENDLQDEQAMMKQMQDFQLQEQVAEDPKLAQAKKEERIKMKIGKSIAAPLFEYNGILFCDSIIDNVAQFLPKTTDSGTHNASCQFKKCLFRIEVLDSFTSLLKLREAEKEFEKLLAWREELLIKSDNEELDKHDFIVAQKRKDLEQLRIAANREDIDNKTAQKQSFGQKIQYGQPFLLRHVFSNQYLQIKPQEMAIAQGKIKVGIGELSPLAKLKLVPSQDINQFSSEMLINTQQVNKFSLQVGGHVNVKDAFYIMNSEIGFNYYFHVNRDDPAGRDGPTSIVELSAGFEPSKIRSKLFLDAFSHFDAILDSYKEKTGKEKISSRVGNEQDDQVIYSGDIVRLLHQESGVYLQSVQKNLGDRSLLPPYPDFLNQQITKLAEEAERYTETEEEMEEENKLHIEELEVLYQNQQLAGEQYNMRSSNKVVLDQDPRCNYFTNSCWEVQKTKVHKGGIVCLNGVYRFKHIATETYLSLDEGRFYLELRDDALFSVNSLFCLRSLNQEQEMAIDEYGEEIEGKPIQDKTKVYIESYFKTYLQVYDDIDDDSKKTFKYSENYDHLYYTQYNPRKLLLTPISGAKQRKHDQNEPKMIFQFVYVPPTEALVVFQTNRFFFALSNFFAFLNSWAVAQSGLSNADAAKNEPQLERESRFIAVVLHKILVMLNETMQLSSQRYHELQQRFIEQRILELLGYTLELIYYKTMPDQYREKPFKPDKFKANLGAEKVLPQGAEEHLVFQIAREYLDSINSLILKVLFAMVHNNDEGCSRLTRFSDILSLQFLREDRRLVSKIMRHVYKIASYKFNDRGSVMHSDEGIYQRLSSSFTITHHISKYMTRLETISLKDEANQNIERQISYLQLLTSFCKTKSGWQHPCVRNQILVINNIINFESKVPVWFGYQRRDGSQILPFVFFARLAGETIDTFLEMNPTLADNYSTSVNQDGQKTFDIIYDLADLSAKCQEDRQSWLPYIRYIVAVIDFYSAICAGRNFAAITAMREKLGFTNTFIKTILSADSIDQNYHQLLKSSIFKLCKTLIIDYQPYVNWLEKPINVYIWDQLGAYEPSQTVYRWEKSKYGEQVGGGSGISPADCEDMIKLLRKLAIDYIQVESEELRELLYSYEGKKYHFKELNTFLQELINNMDTVHALLQSENADSVLTASLMTLCYSLLAGFASVEQVYDLQDKWIYKLQRAANKMEQCRHKVHKLVSKALAMLVTISLQRGQKQLFKFVQIFKDFQEGNKLTYINFDSLTMHRRFKALFGITQFQSSQDIKLLQRYMVMLNPDLPIVTDQASDLAMIDKGISTVERTAIKKMDDEIFAKIAVFGAKVAEEDQVALNKEDGAEEEEEEKPSVIPEPEQTIEKKRSMVLEAQMTVAQHSLYSQQIPIDEYLIYFAFFQTSYQQLPGSAIAIINDMVHQREQLLEKAVTVELCVSKSDNECYNQIKEMRERFRYMTRRIQTDEELFILARLGKNEDTKTRINDLRMIIGQLKQMLTSRQEEPVQLLKVQNIMRNVEFVDLFINQLFKGLYYDRVLYRHLFQDVLDLLFLYCHNNQLNQQSIQQHVPYLFDLISRELTSGKVIAQVIRNQRQTTFGQKFIQFACFKIREEFMLKSQVFRMLTVLAKDSPNIQSFIMSKLVPDLDIKNKLYMNQHTSSMKIDRIKELARKQILYGAQTKADRLAFEDTLELDYERIYTHFGLIELFTTCCEQNFFATKQLRALIDQDCLFDSILTTAMPFKLKPYYLNLFFRAYIQRIEGLDNIDENHPRVMDMLNFLMFLDLDNYYLYYTGLLTKTTADTDPVTADQLEKVRVDLDKQSQDQLNKIQGRKNYRQKQEEKDALNAVSALNGIRTFLFMETGNSAEYWQYLCTFDHEIGQMNGLLIFIRDFYSAVSDRVESWSQEFRETTTKIRDKLFEIEEKVDELCQTYLKSIEDQQLLFFVIDQAIMAIPDLSVYNRANAKQKQVMLANKYAIFPDYEDMGDETTEKMVRIIRDSVVAKNSSLREMFDIKTASVDVQVQPYFMKRRIKDICGSDVTFREVEWFVRKLILMSDQKLNYRTVQGTEVGQPAYIRGRYMRHAMQAKSQSSTNFVFNFREFEQMLKSTLTKAGYKPPALLRERTILEDKLIMKMAENELSLSCQADLHLFTLSYIEFMQKYRDASELDDLALKILQKFNQAFLDGARKVKSGNVADSIEFKSFRVIKLFLRKMMSNVQSRRQKPVQSTTEVRNKLCLLRILSAMLRQLNPYKVEIQVRHIAAERLKILQNIMIDCGLLRQAVAQVDLNEDPEVVDEALKLVHQLTFNCNTGAIAKLLAVLTNQKDDFCYAFFKQISLKVNDGVHVLVRHLQEQSKESDFDSLSLHDLSKERPSTEPSLAETLQAEGVESYPTKNILSQPFFPPQKSLELRLIHRDNLRVEQVSGILDFLQQICYVDIHATPPYLKQDHFEQEMTIGQSQMQYLMHEQTKAHSRDINMVKCVGQALITIVDCANNIGAAPNQPTLFEQPSLVNLVEKLIKTLTTFVKPELAKTQKLYSDWNQLQRTLNFFIDQDFGFYLVDSDSQRAKIRLLNCTLKLLKDTVQSHDTALQASLSADIRKHLSLESMRHRLIDIFKFKIGGTPNREQIYRAGLMCNHWDGLLHGVFSNAVCTKDEYCFFEHLVPLDMMTIECAQLSFELIYTFNQVLPSFALGNVHFNLEETSWFYQKFYSRFKLRYEFEAFEHIAESALALVNATSPRQGGSAEIDFDQFLDEKAFNKEVNTMLYLLFINFATQKYQLTQWKAEEYDILQQETSFIVGGIDDPDRIIIEQAPDEKAITNETKLNPIFLDDAATAEWDELFIDLIQRRRPVTWSESLCCQRPLLLKEDGSTRNRWAVSIERVFRILCCCMCLARFRTQRHENSLFKARNLIKQMNSITDKQEKEKIQNYFSSRSLQLQKSRDYIGQMTGSFSKQILQEQTYIFDQFKFEYTYRFFLENYQSVEIVLADGSLRKEYFLLPMYCTYLCQRAKQEILGTQIEHATTKVVAERNEMRLKKLFKSLDRIKAEMEYQQIVALQLPLLDQVAHHWRLFQWAAFIVVAIINLTIFLTTQAVNSKIQDDYFGYLLKFDIMKSETAQLTMTHSFASLVEPNIERLQMLVVLLLLLATAGFQFLNSFSLQQSLTAKPPHDKYHMDLDDLGLQSVPFRSFAPYMGIRANQEPHFLTQVVTQFGLIPLAPFLMREQAFNWIQLLLALASLHSQFFILILLLVQIGLYVPFLRAVGSAVYNSRGKMLSVLVLYVVCIYIFAYIVFYTMPKYQFAEFSVYHDKELLNTENLTFAHYTLHPDAPTNRSNTLYWVKNMNETDQTKWVDIFDSFDLPPPEARFSSDQSMWSIVQNYAEYQLFEGYNNLVNFLKIITFFGISNLSLSTAFTLAMQQNEDSSPIKDLLTEASDEFLQSQRISYEWQDTVLDFAFLTITLTLLVYLVVAVIVNLLHELRLQKEANTASRSLCFVCGRTKEDITRTGNWKRHISEDHNIFSYINYVLYIRQRVIDEYSRTKKDKPFNTSQFLSPVQQYVLDKVEKGDISFMPKH